VLAGRGVVICGAGDVGSANNGFGGGRGEDMVGGDAVTVTVVVAAGNVRDEQPVITIAIAASATQHFTSAP
jgi:hypothetical protein